MHSKWIQQVVSWTPPYIDKVGELGLLPGEAALVEAIWQGKVCDLSQAAEDQRHIRADFLAWFVTSRKVRSQVSSRGVEVQGAILVDQEGELAEILLSGAQVRFPLHLKACRMKSFIAQNAHFQALTLSQSFIREKIDLSYAHIDGLLDLSEICAHIDELTDSETKVFPKVILEEIGVEGSLDLSSSRVAGVVLTHALIKGNLRAGGLLCRRAFTASNLQAGTLYLEKAEIYYCLDLSYARINGNVLCRHLICRDDVLLRSAVIEGDLDFLGFFSGSHSAPKNLKKKFSPDWEEYLKEWDQSFAEDIIMLSGRWTLKGAENFRREVTGEWSLEDAIVKGRLILKDVALGEGVLMNLQGASIGTLEDDEKSWPQPGNLLLHGLKIGSLSPNSVMEASKRIGWIRRQYPVIVGGASFWDIVVGGIGTLLALAGIVWGFFVIFSSERPFDWLVNLQHIPTYQSLLTLLPVVWTFYILTQSMRLNTKEKEEGVALPLIGPPVFGQMGGVFTLYAFLSLFRNSMGAVVFNRFLFYSFGTLLLYMLISRFFSNRSGEKYKAGLGCLFLLPDIALLFYPIYLDYQLHRHDILSFWQLILVLVSSLLGYFLYGIVNISLVRYRRKLEESQQGGIQRGRWWTISGRYFVYALLFGSFLFHPAIIFHLKNDYPITIDGVLSFLLFMLLWIVSDSSQRFINHAAYRRRYQRFEIQKPQSKPLESQKKETSNEQEKERDRASTLQEERSRVFASFYSPQPYEELARYYQRIGRRDEMIKVKIAQYDDSIQYGPVMLGEDTWRLLLRYTTGYGYRLWYALVWTAVIVGIGTALFEYAYEQKLISPASTDVLVSDEYRLYRRVPPDYPRFDPFLYSLDVFVPIIDLKMENFYLIERCLPDSPAGDCRGHPLTSSLRWYLRFQIFMGWLLSTLLVAGITGLIRGGGGESS